MIFYDILLISFLNLISVLYCSADRDIYDLIWTEFEKTSDPLADFTSDVFDYTAGVPRFISLWNMQNPKFKECFLKGFPRNIDMSSTFPDGTTFKIGQTETTSSMSTSNVELIGYLLEIDSKWYDKEKTMPLYYFPRVINLYRFLHAERKRGGIVPLFVDYEEIVFLYIYLICAVNGAGVWDYDGMCPNLCGNKGVCSKNMLMIPNTCTLIDKGVFDHQYKCTCRFGLAWDQNTHQCVSLPSIPCGINDLNKYCVSSNTKSCEVTTYSLYPICNCKKGYHGVDCSLKDSRCLLPSSDGKLPSGYESCRVLEGGQCYHVTKDEYTCVCPNEFEHDPNFSYMNCFKKKKLSMCSITTCLNGGQCVQVSEITIKCNCPDGYTGFYCQFPLGTWTAWTSWSQCYPRCGPRRLQYKFRDCLGDTSCVGSMIDWTLCSSVTCPEIKWRNPLNLSSILHSIFSIDKDYNPTYLMLLYTTRILIAEILVILVVGAIFTLLSWLLFIFHQSFRGIVMHLRRFKDRLKQKKEIVNMQPKS